MYYYLSESPDKTRSSSLHSNMIIIKQGLGYYIQSNQKLELET